MTTPSPRTNPIRYVALGDSYTIGTSIHSGDAWPNQLVESVDDRFSLELVANLAVNGYTSDDLIRAELPALADLQPEFVSILIGVNDVVQDVPPDRYRTNVAADLLHPSGPQYARWVELIAPVVEGLLDD